MDLSGHPLPSLAIQWGEASTPSPAARLGGWKCIAVVRLEARDYDIGHWIAPEEAHDAVAFVESL